MLKVKSQRNASHFLRSHNPSRAEHGFEPTIVQFPARALDAIMKGLPRSVGLIMTPILSQSIHLVHWSKRWGLGNSTPPHGLMGVMGGRCYTLHRSLGRADLQHSPEPHRLAMPIVSELGMAQSINFALLMDIRQEACEHRTLVRVYKRHYKHHGEWEKNKASLFTAGERQKTLPSICLITLLYREGKITCKSFSSCLMLMDLPFGDGCF